MHTIFLTMSFHWGKSSQPSITSYWRDDVYAKEIYFINNYEETLLPCKWLQTKSQTSNNTTRCFAAGCVL